LAKIYGFVATNTEAGENAEVSDQVGVRFVFSYGKYAA
jgi:hypothetical protein